MYAVFWKRVCDFVISFTALVVLLPLLLILYIVGAIAMKGNPIFIQPRPGKKGKDGKERIFYLLKFKTMSNACDENGELLPDALRLSKYGKWLRTTSLDELPSLINILRGDIAIVGPRPQLVRDMVFMTEEQRKRHDVRPGLTGLAQINGRNNIPWEQKFVYDLQYINNGITFAGDMAIIFKTIGRVLKKADIVRDGTVSDMDFGDWLMQEGRITNEEYVQKCEESKELLRI